MSFVVPVLAVLLVAAAGAAWLTRSALRAERAARVADRALDEARSHAADARFSSVVESIDHGVFTIGLDGRIASVVGRDTAFRTDTGESVVGAGIGELVGPGADVFVEGMRQRTLAGERVTFEIEPAASPGRMFRVTASPLCDQSNTVIATVAVMRDVTTRKRAEASSEWQRRVLEEIASGMALGDSLVTIARFFEAQCPAVDCIIHMLDEDGVVLRSMAAPTSDPTFVEAMDEIVVGPRAATCGTAVHRRATVITRDVRRDSLWNDYRALALEQNYLACWAMPIRSPQGRVVGAISAYARDVREPTPGELRVTETATQLAGIAADRARAAESLRQSEASFRSFVENSPIGIYRATGTGRLLAVNPSLVQLLGYDSAFELLQLDLRHDVFAHTEEGDRLLRDLESRGEVHTPEVGWRRRDGSVVTVRVTARANRDDRGMVWFSEGFVENVTPLRLAEQALRQSEKLAALGQLVSGVAHELNNPLAAILHFAEDLLEDRRSAGDLEALTMIRDQARRSRAIVRDLLSFVRFRDASRERIGLRDALSASLKALRPTIDEFGATLVSELPDPGARGNTDRAGLQQIMTNLVVNAAQAAGAGGVVRVRALASDRELVLMVEDNGPGIPAGVIDRIFEPFFTTKPVGEGTGLGLSVTLGIVQQLGGRVTAENIGRAPGPSAGAATTGAETGARFTVVLPIDGLGIPEAPARPTRHTPPTVQRIVEVDAPRALIIDDEPSIRSALRRFFTRRGWQVEEAEDGSSGLNMILAGTNRFTVVISDLKMPGFSGVELHDRLAAVDPDILRRVIFSTGDVASSYAAEFVRRTQCTVLQKPFELRALETVVNRVKQELLA